MLYAFLNGYADEAAFELTLEHYCNTGAAEFLILGQTVSKVIREQGFGIRLVEHFDTTCYASKPAIAIQLAQSTPHNCRALVCQWGPQRPSASRQRSIAVAKGATCRQAIIAGGAARWSRGTDHAATR